MRSRIWMPAAVVLAALVVVSAASAHATMSPPVALAKTLQQFTLSVPTEKAGATTTEIELTVPPGFAIDSFEPPAAGWTQKAQPTKVIWTGGHVPTGEDAVFRFDASTSGAKTYTFDVRQTYSDGTVVEWSGPASSDTPAPSVDAVSSLGGGGSSLLSIVALVVGALGLLVGIVALASRGGRSLT
ncbi:MAG TPA: DUF1775 domain-containing protein [Gaiellaceae bacterium]|nr:DUF1775 domain-containing protein [Gaiellaceae bacterium]